VHQPEESSMRMHKPGFKDPKLIVGLILILISIAGVIGIIRINNQNWRLIGYKSDNFKSVLHVIGFDFNYSAYKH